jgi:hypothetical protein
MQGLLNRIRPQQPQRARPQSVAAGSTARPLRSFIDGVLAGTGRAVWIEGEPGSGKSDLLSRVLSDAEVRGGRVADCSTPGSAPRFGLDPILERLGFEPASAELHRVVASRSGLLAVLRRLSADAPLIIAVDELDRTDAAGLEFWGRLAAETRSLPLLLLATARPDHHRPELARIRDDGRSRPVRIAICQCGPADLEAVR